MFDYSNKKFRFGLDQCYTIAILWHSDCSRCHRGRTTRPVRTKNACYFRNAWAFRVVAIGSFNKKILFLKAKFQSCRYLIEAHIYYPELFYFFLHMNIAQNIVRECVLNVYFHSVRFFCFSLSGEIANRSASTGHLRHLKRSFIALVLWNCCDASTEASFVLNTNFVFIFCSSEYSWCGS